MKKTTAREPGRREAGQTEKYEEIHAALLDVDEILKNLSLFDKISSEEELNAMLPGLLASMGRYSLSDRDMYFLRLRGKTRYCIWLMSGVQTASVLPWEKCRI